jgi:hypothetical protein
LEVYGVAGKIVERKKGKLEGEVFIA